MQPRPVGADARLFFNPVFWRTSAEAAREEATLRRETVLKALAPLGYEVREGMATAWAENGRVVVGKPSESNYGVELASPPQERRKE